MNQDYQTENVKCGINNNNNKKIPSTKWTHSLGVCGELTYSGSMHDWKGKFVCVWLDSDKLHRWWRYQNWPVCNAAAERRPTRSQRPFGLTAKPLEVYLAHRVVKWSGVTLCLRSNLLLPPADAPKPQTSAVFMRPCGKDGSTTGSWVLIGPTRRWKAAVPVPEQLIWAGSMNCA